MSQGTLFCPACEIPVSVADSRSSNACDRCHGPLVPPHKDPCANCGGAVAPDGSVCVDCGHSPRGTAAQSASSPLRFSTAAGLIAVGLIGVAMIWQGVVRSLQTGIYQRVGAHREDILREDNLAQFWLFVSMKGLGGLLLIGLAVLGFFAMLKRGSSVEVKIRAGRS